MSKCPHCDDGKIELSDMGIVRCRWCNPDPNNDSDWLPEETEQTDAVEAR